MEVVFGADEKHLTGPIAEAFRVVQKFEAEAGRLESVLLVFATYMRANPGSVKVEVVDFRGMSVAVDEVPSADLVDNEYREFSLGVGLIPGREYSLVISTTGAATVKKSVTAKFGSRSLETGRLTVGTSFVSGAELSCIFRYGEDEPRDRFFVDPGNLAGGLVSVVIPHYECPDLLVRCLRSLAFQTYRCVEVFVVDDGSSCAGKVEAIVDAWRPAIPALQYVGLSENGGAPAARNAGARTSCGEYLLFLDADVELYPSALETMVSGLLGDRDAAFVYGSFWWGKMLVEPVAWNLEELKRGNYVTTMSMMRREVFPGFDESLERHQDWDLWLTVADAGHVGVYCERTLFETPVRANSISTDENVPVKESRKAVWRKHGIADPGPPTRSMVDNEEPVEGAWTLKR